MKYELTVILEAGQEKNEETLKQIEALIEAQKGKVSSRDDWGLKRFTYPIDKKDSGHYFLIKFELEPKKLAEFEKKMHLMGELVRYMVVRV